jgi:hypothetical protein
MHKDYYYLTIKLANFLDFQIFKFGKKILKNNKLKKNYNTDLKNYNYNTITTTCTLLVLFIKIIIWNSNNK